MIEEFTDSFNQIRIKHKRDKLPSVTPKQPHRWKVDELQIYWELLHMAEGAEGRLLCANMAIPYKESWKNPILEGKRARRKDPSEAG